MDIGSFIQEKLTKVVNKTAFFAIFFYYLFTELPLTNQKALEAVEQKTRVLGLIESLGQSDVIKQDKSLQSSYNTIKSDYIELLDREPLLRVVEYLTSIMSENPGYEFITSSIFWVIVLVFLCFLPFLGYNLIYKKWFK